MTKPLELKLSSSQQAMDLGQHIWLIKSREEQPVKFLVTFSRNGLIVRQQLNRLKDFIYLMFDLQYNNNPIISIEIIQDNSDNNLIE